MAQRTQVPKKRIIGFAERVLESVVDVLSLINLSGSVL
ncbi:hypothetical protein IMCC1989_2583 [gamma proteobacterium IMCC1989]|nr:hypothetical protein IMCC1989_2583 [gamma proteobacterium IMCC1989]